MSYSIALLMTTIVYKASESLGQEAENESDADSTSPTTPGDFWNNEVLVASGSASGEDEDPDYAPMPGGFGETIGADDDKNGSYFPPVSNLVSSTGWAMNYVRQRGLNLPLRSR
jgi:hypothetical protein